MEFIFFGLLHLTGAELKRIVGAIRSVIICDP
jgi:hypothetical protein